MKDHLELLKEELEEGTAAVFDIREENEWVEGHLTEARFVPLSKLKDNTFSFENIHVKNKKVYLYCRSGNRVHTAKPLLEGQGFKNVVSLNEGFLELQSYGFPSVLGK